MGGTLQQAKLWRRLPYTLAMLGLLVILLGGLSLWRGQRPAVPPIGASSPLAGANDQDIQRLQDRLRLQPEDSGVYVRLGTSYLQKARETGDPSYYYRAEEAFSRALSAETDPSSLKARSMTGMGTAALGRHEFTRALEWAQRSIEIDPSYAGTYGVLGDAQLELGQYENATKSFQAMVDLKPDLGSYARAARVRELHGDTDGAIDAMKMAAAAGAGQTEADAWARVQLGNLYFNSGKIEEAVRQYEISLMEFNGYYPALYSLGKARAAQGDYKTAIGLLEQSVAVVPQPTVLALLGDLYSLNGQPDKAQLQYDTVEFIARLSAFNEQAYNREISLFYADHDLNLETSLELSQRELEVRKDIYGYDALAWSLFKNHRVDEAAVAIEQAMRLGTQDAHIFFHAGVIYHAMGDLPLAKFYLEKVMALNSRFSVLHAERASELLEEINRSLHTSANSAAEVTP